MPKAKNLFENFSKRLIVAESLYKKAHNGEAFEDSKKVVVATCLNNMHEFLNESFSTSSATQLGDLGALTL